VERFLLGGQITGMRLHLIGQPRLSVGCTSKPHSKRSYSSSADGRSPHTIRQYRRHGTALANWLAATKTPTDVAKLTPAVLAEFFADDAAKKPAPIGKCSGRWVDREDLPHKLAVRERAPILGTVVRCCCLAPRIRSWKTIAELNALGEQVPGWPHDASAVILKALHSPNLPSGDEDVAAWSKAPSADAQCAWYAIAKFRERTV
jgi:hypothetical protein